MLVIGPFEVDDRIRSCVVAFAIVVFFVMRRMGVFSSTLFTGGGMSHGSRAGIYFGLSFSLTWFVYWLLF